MANYRAEVTAKWEADPEGGFTPLLDYVGVRWQEVAGQPGANIPTKPNAVSVKLERVDGVVLAAMEADPDVVVLWSEEI